MRLGRSPAVTVVAEGKSIFGPVLGFVSRGLLSLREVIFERKNRLRQRGHRPVCSRPELTLVVLLPSSTSSASSSSEGEVRPWLSMVSVVGWGGGERGGIGVGDAESVIMALIARCCIIDSHRANNLEMSCCWCSIVLVWSLLSNCSLSGPLWA